MSPSLLGVSPVDHPGGAEVALLRLVERLAKRGWDISLTSPSADSPLAQQGFEHHKLDVGGLGAREGARAVASFPKALRLGAKHDVVYLNSTVAGRLLPALRATKTVLHVHDLVERVPRHWSQADLVLTPAQAAADRLEGLEAQVVHAPIVLDPPHKPSPWERDGGAIVGYMGRIEPLKGVADLVQAAPRIREGSPGARVLIVGEDPYGTDPAYLERVTSDPAIEHHPWLQDAPSAMRHLDVLVVPSYSEVFGTVLSEAMAVGTPVVATRVGGLAEVVEDGVTGALVEPGDPEALAEGVLRVLAARDRMGPAARRAARRFDADRYTDRIENLLKQLLARP